MVYNSFIEYSDKNNRQAQTLTQSVYPMFCFNLKIERSENFLPKSRHE
jgi:hypothetical protein